LEFNNLMLENDYINYMHLEISSLCNAACPCCPRFNSTSPKIAPGQFLGYISYEDFIKWFPKEVMVKVRYLNFCGNHGDPGTNPDLPKILNYLSQFRLRKFQMHTNGGMKSPKFWDEVGYELNNMKASNVTFTFSIDGLEDTNHIYRRNVKWDKLISNVKEVTKYKNIFVIWDYLVFKHNEHQLEEAEKLSKELGFAAIEFKAPVNLDDGENITPISVLDTEGKVKYWLEPTDLDKFKPSYLPDNPKVKLKEEQLWLDKINSDFGCTLDGDWKDYIEANETNIVPRCGHNDLYVDVDGTVHPCCFVGLGFSAVRSAYDKGGYVNYQFRQMFEAHEKYGRENFNLRTSSIDKILTGGLINKIYNDKWKSTVLEGKQVACAKYCGKKNSLDTIFELHREEKLNSRNEI